MGIPSILNTGKSGMMASRAAIATAGHNIANANTEGYSRQRVLTAANDPAGATYGRNTIGTGTKVDRIERVNDEYIERHIRNNARDLSNLEEKDMALRQVEDIFNEMNGDGLNRLVARFFNEFRKLADEPENEAVRESVREASQAMVNDFHRLRNEVVEASKHLDSRIEGYTREANSIADQIRDLNQQIQKVQTINGDPNDLLDKRDEALRKLATFVDISMYKDKVGSYSVDMKNVGPYVAGPDAEHLSVERSSADAFGKPEGAYDVRSTGNAHGIITHAMQGGKIGALIETRDKTLGAVLNRLDELAYSIAESVNSVHRQGYTASGEQGVDFFRAPEEKARAAEFLDLSDAVKGGTDQIATGLLPDSPGDNRVAIMISRLQGDRIMDKGNATFDDYFNSIVSTIGVDSSKVRGALNQQRDVMTQLQKMRDQISGVSVDEETTNLMEFQHMFDASAKVIQVADEMLKTILELKR